jgi:hypothetical protein
VLRAGETVGDTITGREGEVGDAGQPEAAAGQAVPARHGVEVAARAVRQFVLRAGETVGDTITDFVRGTDTLAFYGFGTDAVLSGRGAPGSPAGPAHAKKRASALPAPAERGRSVTPVSRRNENRNAPGRHPR